MPNWVHRACIITFFLIFYLVFQLIVFICTTSVCVGVALLWTFAIEVILATIGALIQVPQYVAICFALYFVSQGAKLDCGVNPNVCLRIRNRFADLKKEFPFVLKMVPSLCEVFAMGESFYQLFNQYEIVHKDLSPPMSTPGIHFTDDPAIPGTEDENGSSEMPYYVVRYGSNVAVFVFSMAYLVFSISRILEGQTNKINCILFSFYLIGTPPEKDNTVTTLVFVGCQTALTVVYSFPLINVLILLNNIFSNGHAPIFWAGSATALLIGLIAGYIESRSPFPTEPNKEPQFLYENQAKARLYLLQFIMTPSIAIAFFGSGVTQEFDPGIETFNKFTAFVTVTILHITKTLFVANLLKTAQERRELLGLRRNAQVVPMLPLVAINNEPSPNAAGNQNLGADVQFLNACLENSTPMNQNNNNIENNNVNPTVELREITSGTDLEEDAGEDVPDSLSISNASSQYNQTNQTNLL